MLQDIHSYTKHPLYLQHQTQHRPAVIYKELLIMILCGLCSQWLHSGRTESPQKLKLLKYSQDQSNSRLLHPKKVFQHFF